MKKNIINLSKLFIKDNISNYDIIKDRRINKKSMLFWIFIILFIGISWISQQLIDYFYKIGKTEIFLNFYLLFLELLLVIQSILMCTNLFFYSKDIEELLPLPFKPIEILIAKVNTLIFTLYGTEVVLALVPFLIYGIIAKISLIFYINLIIVLLIFPIFIAIIISIITIFLMRFMKIFKKKETLQLIITTILIVIIGVFLSYIYKNVLTEENEALYNTEIKQQQLLTEFNNKLINVNKYFLILNPISEILQNNKVIFNYIKVILINVFAYCILHIVGTKIYLRQLLKSNNYIKQNNSKKINLDKKSRQKNRIISYLRKDRNILIKNPLFFMQSIYPIIIITVLVCTLLIVVTPKIIEVLNTDEYKDKIVGLKFDFEALCLILGLVQVVGLFNYTSVTAFSREGKEAFLMKTIPIDLYKQFVIKNIPQVFINTICSVIILGIIKFLIPAIEFKYILIIFALSFIMILINSYILSLIDLLNPKLNWDAEYEILQNNNNKLLQYVLIIFNILFLIYFYKIFKDKNLDKSILVFGNILLFIFIIFNFILIKFKNKLFKKIN